MRAARPADDDPRHVWLNAFQAVRGETERRAALLSAEDQLIQSMPDASPTKWHRAHTTWFFEQFLLRPFVPDYAPFDERFAFLFNSYYVAAGPRQARPQRGLITRPNAAEVAEYRAHVDAAVAALIRSAEDFDDTGPHHRDRPQSRAAAPGIAAHRHSARVFIQRNPSGLRSAIGNGRKRRAKGRPRARRSPASI